MARGRGRTGYSSCTRIMSRPATGAAKDSPFSRKAQPEPTAVISTPASAGPTSRADWKLAEFRLTALATCAGPTISETNVCRAGLSTTVTRPSRKAAR
ncbi:hypothetical protein GCM10020254_47710 [Streptomyces goshikiensis]